MKKLTPRIIAEITGGKYIGEESAHDEEVLGAERDNRDIKPGNLFVCIPGAKVDGHDYANSAFEAGAVCALAEREIPNAKGAYVLVESTLKAFREIAEYYRKQFDIPFIGITGSVGKTTGKELIASVLSATKNVLYTKMNLNNDIGVPLTLLSLNDTHDVAVVEMGINDFGDMSILAQMVRPDIFVMTKIGYSHIDNLKTLQGVLKAKTEAFMYMKPDSIAVMNGDDELLLNFDTQRKTYTFGLDEHNDFRAVNVQNKGTDLIELDIESDKGRFPIKINTYGSHIASLAPSAVAIGRLLGLSDKEITTGFLKYLPVEGRSRVSESNGITVIDDCYNANPNSVKAALTSLSSLKGRRVVILGDMLGLGDIAEDMHREVGAFAAETDIDMLICQGPLAKLIYDEYKATGGKSAEYYSDMNELITNIHKYIKKGDTVLLKASRGMKFEQLLPHLS